MAQILNSFALCGGTNSCLRYLFGEVNMKLSELVDFIKKNDIAIYGTGFVAKTFYVTLEIWNLEKKVKYFIVTDEEKARGTLQGIPIRALKDIASDTEVFICIAVHEAIKDEIEIAILKQNRDNYMWVHPYIVKLALGELVEHHKKMAVSQLIRMEPQDNYALAVRHLAIENYYKKNDIGYGIYVKIFSIHYEVETARSRLKKFIDLIGDWDRNGYRQEKDILIDEKQRRIEGTHRLSLACYHKMEYIYCDIYPYSDNYNKIMKGGSYLSMKLLRNCGLNSSELNALEWANEEFFRRGTQGI